MPQHPRTVHLPVVPFAAVSTQQWWVIAPEGGFEFEQRADGNLVVVDRKTSEEHVLHGYEWKHRKDADGVQVHGEGPPPFGKWIAAS